MRIALHNFTGGEVSPILAARYDLSRYGSSVQCMENMLPGLHGDVRRRPGTLFLGSLEDEAVLLPFSFNALAEQNFVLVLSGNGLSIADIHGFDPQEGSIPRLPTPYEARHLLEICAAQVGDTVYLAHTAYPLHKLVRSTDSEPESPLPENAIRSHGYRWTLEAVALNSSLPAPQAPSCTFVRGNNDDDAGLGYTLRYKIVAVDANGKQSLASEAGSCNGKHPSDWVVGNRTDLSWTAVEGATEYNIYREEAGYYGFIGVSSGTTFSDNNYQADTADTPREDWDPFADGNNPSVVAFHQQRMVLAGTRDSPQAFYLSRSGDFENFRKSRPLQDDDPVEYLIASGSIDAIAWAASFGDLLLGTSGSEYKASGNGSAITPGNITITAQSYWGSAGLAPIIIGNAILHVQRHGAHVRDLFYSLEKDGYAGNDLSILAPHLFEGHRLRQWAYQQTPGSVLWIVRDDGLLLALTYLKEHDIWGWSRHPTAGDAAHGQRRAVAGGPPPGCGRRHPLLSGTSGPPVAGQRSCGGSFFCGLRSEPSPGRSGQRRGRARPSGRPVSGRAGGREPRGRLRGATGPHPAALCRPHRPSRPALCLRPVAPARGRQRRIRQHAGTATGAGPLLPASVPQRGRALRSRPRRTLRHPLPAPALG